MEVFINFCSHCGSHIVLWFISLPSRPPSQHTFRFVAVGKAQVLLITLTMALFCSSVPVSHDSVTVGQHARYQDPETEAAKWNPAIINFIIYLCFFYRDMSKCVL